MKINNTYLAVVLLLCGIAIIYLAAPGSWQPYIGMLLMALAIIIYFSDNQLYAFNDAKKLYIAAQRSPAGRNRLPDWDTLQAHQLHWETRGHLILYKAIIGAWDWEVVLNSRPDSTNPMLIYDIRRQEVNPHATADTRADVDDRAYGIGRKKSIDEEIRHLTSLGFDVIPRDVKKYGEKDER